MTGFTQIFSLFGQILVLFQTILPSVINIFTLFMPIVDYLSAMFSGLG